MWWVGPNVTELKYWASSTDEYRTIRFPLSSLTSTAACSWQAVAVYALGNAAYNRYLDDLKAGVKCDCDFHQGRWNALDGQFSTKFGPLKYAKDNSYISSATFCNHPSKTSQNEPLPTISVGGVRCARCGLPNEYGSPNRPDGSYVCYECR